MGIISVCPFQESGVRNVDQLIFVQKYLSMLYIADLGSLKLSDVAQHVTDVSAHHAFNGLSSLMHFGIFQPNVSSLIVVFFIYKCVRFYHCFHLTLDDT